MDFADFELFSGLAYLWLEVARRCFNRAGDSYSGAPAYNLSGLRRCEQMLSQCNAIFLVRNTPPSQLTEISLEVQFSEMDFAEA